ncbi:hypothetical protein ACHMW6_24185 [Pseudoduganella sp. UC29_106]|uniref:hypothetical protein n=1 Tax=Pseudoduganella sp. UC29_106 TaxID=3374553 RepID=UPI003756CA3C
MSGQAPSPASAAPSPRFHCAACDRAVLNGDFPRCLYCGADLPPEVSRAAPTRAVAPQSLAESSKSGVVDGVVDAIDIAGTIADGISIIGDLLD